MFLVSGSSWIRYLIQQSTGFMTGSETPDPELQGADFPGEGIRNASVLVINSEW